MCTCTSSVNGPSATRDLPDACVNAGAQFDVTIDISDCAMGQVTETLCDGWTYVPDSATSTGTGGVTVATSGNDVTLTFFSVSQIAYKVQAPGQEDECCGITGELDDNSQTYAIGGETQDVCTCPDLGYCLNLKAGWNFVSVPKKLNGTNDATTIFDIDPATETCEYYCASTGTWMNLVDIDVTPCRGFWVYKTSPAPIYMDFKSTGPIVPPTQQLYTGWNMIGHIDMGYMSIDDGTAADFGSMATIEGNFAQIWQWTPDSNWELCYPSGLGYMTHGQGYWILMTANATMSGTP